MRILLIDDDNVFLDKLKNDLLNRFDLSNQRLNFDIYTSDFNSISMCYYYDFVFIDIDLVTENGIELAKKIQEKSFCNFLVFISSHANLVHDSLLVRPFYFIRKSYYNKDILSFFSLINDIDKYKDFIEVKCVDGSINAVAIKDIIFIESNQHSLYIFTIHGVYECNRKLREIYADLNSDSFVQIHRSYVINLNHLINYNSCEVYLSNNQLLTVGRKYKDAFLKAYKLYLTR